MSERLIISGFGVIGTEVLHQIIKRNKFKKIHISIIEKNYSNFPGGVAYSKLSSKYGFFNNPLRLSNNGFKGWVAKNINQKRLINFFRQNKNLKLDQWLKKNVKENKDKFLNLRELYLPRIAYAIYLEDMFFKSLKVLKKKKFIKIDFFENEVVKIQKEKKSYKCFVKKNLIMKSLTQKKSGVIFKNKKTLSRKCLKCNSIIFGVGILPPSNVNLNSNFKNENYIHDFYSSGGTNNLINRLKNFKYRQKKTNIIFIGNKAGLLETMQQIENLDKRILNNLSITSISPSTLSLQKALLSKKYRSYKFKYLVSKNINKIVKSKEILSLIKSEFHYGQKKGYNKYDVWTQILQKNILDKCFKKLNSYERKSYNNKVFKQLRTLTRYTYPETVDAKNRLEKIKVLKNLKDKVTGLIKEGSKIKVKTINSGNFLADIVINVSGPVSLFKNHNEVPYLNSLKKICKKFNDRGFISDEFHQITDRIYAPGTLSSNFNPERKTIIKSITENCNMTAKHLIKSINN